MFEKLEKVKSRYHEIADLLSKPETINDQNEFRKLSKEYSSLTEIVETYDAYNKLKIQLEENKDLLHNTKDAELKELAKEEQELLENKFSELELKIKDLLVPDDPENEKNAILEIRAGTGGDEAALFAAELYRMYQKNTKGRFRPAFCPKIFTLIFTLKNFTLCNFLIINQLISNISTRSRTALRLNDKSSFPLYLTL